MTKGEQVHLEPEELSDRWRLSPDTLARWRCHGKGPSFIKIGGKILYPKSDVLDFEEKQKKNSNPLGRLQLELSDLW